jgi:clan AA aspartic protease
MTMRGTVSDLHALMPVTLRLRGQPDLTVEFVIDTGFDGALSLPQAAVSAMNLPFFEDIRANLANDSDVMLPVHVATIIWQGSPVVVRVLATGRRPLLGTALLSGQHLAVDFDEGGRVTIGPIPELPE